MAVEQAKLAQTASRQSCLMKTMTELVVEMVVKVVAW